MRNKNTQGKVEYLLETLLWTLLALWYYRNVLFSTVPGVGYDGSVRLLYLLAAGGAALGILLTFRRRRNWLSVLTGALCSLGTYFVLSFWQTSRGRILRLLAVAVLAAVCYGGVVLLNYIRDRRAKRTQASVWKCVYGCVMGGRTIVAMGLAVLMIGGWVGLLTGAPFLTNGTVNASEAEQIGSGETIGANMETILLLQEDQWERLDPDGDAEPGRSDQRGRGNHAEGRLP